MSPSRSVRSGIILGLWLLAAGAVARAEGPADGLLDLVPRDAAVTLTVEGLRERSREFLDSPLAGALRDLPAVRAWQESDGYRRLARARTEIEEVLGLTLEQARDELLGEAVVLALQLGPGGGPEGARGLLLVRVGDRALLDRLIARANDLETLGGTLEAVRERTHRDVAFSVRSFRAGSKPQEVYAILGERTFVWSNSEAMLRGVIDRHLGREAGLGSLPEVRPVLNGLPERSVARLLIDPRVLERAIRADASDDPAAELLLRRIAAIRYAGAALEWHDGLFLHLHTLNEVPEGPGVLARAPGETQEAPGAGGLLGRVPRSAPVVVRAGLDLPALADLVLTLVPEADRPRLALTLDVLRGLLLGKDVLGAILPALGPEVVAFADAPEVRDDGSVNVPFVLALAVSGDPDDPLGIPAALENALRTVFSLVALEAGPNRLRVETSDRDGIRVTALLGRSIPLAYALGPGFLVLGTSVESVVSFTAGPAGDDPATSTLARLRAAHFPEANAFVLLDLRELVTHARAHRAALERRIAASQGTAPADSQRDLDAFLSLLDLFQSAFAAARIAPDGTTFHLTLGLLPALPAP